MDRKIVLNAAQLRKTAPSVILSAPPRSGKYPWGETKDLPRHDIYIILDNVLDTYNIGSIFRLADAVAAKKVYLCGGTETPPNHRIKKSSINTTEIVDWEYCETTVEAIKRLKQEFSHPLEQYLQRLDTSYSSREAKPNREVSTIQIVAVEQTKNSVPYDKFDYRIPVALIVGHESFGVSEEVLKLCDATVELPMYGINKSLNVMVSLGIVLYKVLEKLA